MNSCLMYTTHAHSTCAQGTHAVTCKMMYEGEFMRVVVATTHVCCHNIMHAMVRGERHTSWCEGSGGGGGGGMPLVLMMRGHVGAAACSRLYEHFGWGTPHSALKAYSASTGLRSYKKNAHRCVPTGPPPRPLWSHRDNNRVMDAPPSTDLRLRIARMLAVPPRACPVTPAAQLQPPPPQPVFCAAPCQYECHGCSRTMLTSGLCALGQADGGGAAQADRSGVPAGFRGVQVFDHPPGLRNGPESNNPPLPKPIVRYSCFKHAKGPSSLIGCLMATRKLPLHTPATHHHTELSVRPPSRADEWPGQNRCSSRVYL